MSATATRLPQEVEARLEALGDPHVVVAMSGGVDSSVTAMLLREAGVRVSAVFMKNWNEPDDDGRCRWEDDVGDALDVCERLDIEINTVDLSAEYWSGVFEDFVREYARGRTPNPDVLCNREVKFKAFLEHAMALGGDLIATGHYARVTRESGDAYTLLKGVDGNKDQTYFLYAIGQAQLARTLFPIGALAKPVVREYAERAELVTHAKKDSTGICFIGEQPFRDFLSRYVAARPGDIVDERGRAIGHHQGVAFYTLGQRQGLGIGGVSGAREAPWFVIAKRVEENQLVVAQEHEHPELMSTMLEASQAAWVSGVPPVDGSRCSAKTRYRQADQACSVEILGDGGFRLHFDSPQRAVTPGQSAVLYDDNRCLGGGIIESTDRH